jgi:betaine-aldehyde dehydrogenase
MSETVLLPSQRGVYYGGEWHVSDGSKTRDIYNPATGELLAEIVEGSAADVDAAVAAAAKGFAAWRRVAPLERAQILREIAAVIRKRGRELALLDAADGGNPVTELMRDVATAAQQLEFYAGLVTEMKGASVPSAPGSLNFSIREPLGVVARIIPFNHPFMFCAGKAAAPLAAGNSVIIKPPEQAPLSGLRLAELIGHLLPPGTFNVVSGGREVGSALAGHPGVAAVALIGSVATGRAVMRAAAETIKPVLLELGGKNALIAFADSDAAEVTRAVVAGMNFTWCGQSCGSTSRAYIHESLYDSVVAAIAKECAAYRPGLPTDPKTTMGCLVSREHYERVLDHVARAKASGARLVCGGEPPRHPALSKGFFLPPTVFADVTSQMPVAREEIFGPVLVLIRWSDEEQMIREVNDLPYGLTCSIWTRDVSQAHRTAARVEAGYVWINETSRHFLGTPFGGYKQSGLGREECLGELLSFTQEKHVHVNLRHPDRPATDPPAV